MKFFNLVLATVSLAVIAFIFCLCVEARAQGSYGSHSYASSGGSYGSAGVVFDGDGYLFDGRAQRVANRQAARAHRQAARASGYCSACGGYHAVSYGSAGSHSYGSGGYGSAGSTGSFAPASSAAPEAPVDDSSADLRELRSIKNELVSNIARRMELEARIKKLEDKYLADKTARMSTDRQKFATTAAALLKKNSPPPLDRIDPSGSTYLAAR